MDWQAADDTKPSEIITEDLARSLPGKPPASGAWRDGDLTGKRQFAHADNFLFENGATLPSVNVAYETWGTLSPTKDNGVLVLHALTGDSHAVGGTEEGHLTPGWWNGIVGSGKAIDTDKWFVVTPNILGGCQGTTGPATMSPDGHEWGPRFPHTTIRDQVTAQKIVADTLGIERWAAVIGGSMGAMHALEWALLYPERVARLGAIAVPASTKAAQLALNFVQVQAIRNDPGFRDGNYYDASEGEGPHQGLALARRIALISYRSNQELNDRFERSWQSTISPHGHGGRFAIESYLDFHGNKFTRRFDANSYITLVEAMNSHDVGRGRGGITSALARITIPTLVLGIDTDRLFPPEEQHFLAKHIPGNIDTDVATIVHSDFGHDGFLIECERITPHLRRLLEG